jgi:hypothetical protein
MSPIPTQLELIQETWDELGVTELIKEHVPLNRWYLIDRLVRRVFPPGVGGGD